MCLEVFEILFSIILKEVFYGRCSINLKSFESVYIQFVDDATAPLKRAFIFNTNSEFMKRVKGNVGFSGRIV